MKLIVDAGSTKTAWAFCRRGEDPIISYGPGINGLATTSDDVAAHARKAAADAGVGCADVEAVEYFGAGCATDDACRCVAAGLREVFGGEPSVGGDLLCAAKALFPDSDGIACILGTGSNSGLWADGEIRANIPPLGYILGDEGGGVALGKRLVADALRGMIDPELIDELKSDYGLTKEAVLNAVYRSAGGNTYLARLVPFLKKHIDHPDVSHILIEEFSSFILRNVDRYADSRSYPLGFVGSVAYYFAGPLRSVASSLGYTVTRIERDPIAMLARRACADD